MTADRHESSTQKLSTPWGGMFVHVDHIGGSVARARISYPPRLVGSAFGNFLDSVNRAFAQEINEIEQRWEIP